MLESSGSPYLVTPKEAAELLNYSVGLVDQLIKQRRWRTYLVGNHILISRLEVERSMETGLNLGKQTTLKTK